MHRLPVYMIYLWTIINIGRPQDFLPFLRPLHSGDITAILSLITFILFGEKDKHAFSSPEFKIFLYLFAISIICTPFGYYPSYSLQFIKFFYLKVGLYLYLIVKLITTEERIDGMIKTIVLSGFMMAIASIVTKQTGVRYSGGGGYTYDPNDLAMLMVIILPIAIMQGLGAKKFIAKAFYLIGSAVCLIVFNYAMSRGGFIGLLSIVVFMLFIKTPQFSKKWLIAFLIVLAVIFLYKLTPEFKTRLSNITEDISDIKSGSGRILVWRRGFVIFKDHPILGVGPGAFMECYGSYIMEKKFKGDLAANEWGLKQEWKTGHNTYLLVLAELGIFGFLIFMWLIVRSFKNLIYLRTPTLAGFASEKYSLQATGLEISLVGYLVCAFFLTAQTDTILYLILILSGAMIRNSSLEQQGALDVMKSLSEKQSGVKEKK